jgi:hypothetical protein
MGAQPAGFLRDCWRETQFVVWTKRAGDSSNSSALAIKSSAIISNRSARCLSSHSSARRVHTRAWRRKAATKIKGLSFYRDDAAERQSRGRGATRQIAICCNCGATAQEAIDEMSVEYVQEHNLRSRATIFHLHRRIEYALVCCWCRGSQVGLVNTDYREYRRCHDTSTRLRRPTTEPCNSGLVSFSDIFVCVIRPSKVHLPNFPKEVSQCPSQTG